MLAPHVRCRLVALVATLTFVGPDGCHGERLWDGCLSADTRLWQTNSDPRIADCRNNALNALDAAHIRRLKLIAAVIADPTSYGDYNETEAFLRTANRTVLHELNATFDVLDFSSSSISNINDSTFAVSGSQQPSIRCPAEMKRLGSAASPTSYVLHLVVSRHVRRGGGRYCPM